MTLEDHRAMYRDELDFSPSQRTPPVAYTYDQTQRALVPDDRPLAYFDQDGGYIEVPDSATQSTQVGMPMSSRMLRYLQGPAADTPWAHGLFRLRAQCRREHPYHRAADRPYWRGSLCWQLVHFTVVREYSVENAARILRYDNPEPVLRYALTYIEEVIDRERAKAERRAREDEGHGPGAVPQRGHEHHRVPGLHEVDCPQCRRNAA